MRDPPPRDPRPGVPDPVVREHSATVKMVGDPACLLSVGDELTECGEQVVHHRDIRRNGGPAFLGQINGDHDGGWECMILAEDRIFRRMVRRSV